MTDNEKLIEAINRHLPKLTAKRLRIILLMIYEFLKFSVTLEEVEA